MEHREEISEGIMNLELMLTPPFFKAYLPLLRNIKAPAQAKWILLYLLDRQAMKRWPVAYSIIGQDVGGLSPSTVRRMVDKLIRLGLAKVIDRKRDGMVYQVQLESGQNDQSQTDEPSQFHGLLSCKSESGQIDHSRVATLDTITDITDIYPIQGIFGDEFRDEEWSHDQEPTQEDEESFVDEEWCYDQQPSQKQSEGRVNGVQHEPLVEGQSLKDWIKGVSSM